MLKFTKATDSEHKVELESSLISASWTVGKAIGGQSASFEVITEMVGEGAPVKAKGKSEKGKSLGTVKGVMRRNRFTGAFNVPEEIGLGDKAFFEVKLSKNGLDGESEHIPAYPPLRVSNLKWSAQEARRGDRLTLSADIKGLPGQTEVALVIYEYDRDGAHDRIVELPATIEDDHIEVNWEYEYHEDTDEIATQEELDKYGGQYNPPEYFFVVKAEGVEYGRDQESGLLKFKDWVEITLLRKDGTPVGNVDYTMTLPDGQQRQGTLDPSGHAREDDVPPGGGKIEFQNIEDDSSNDDNSDTQSSDQRAASDGATDTNSTTDSAGSKDGGGTTSSTGSQENAEVTVSIQTGVKVSDSAVEKLKAILRASKLTSATITSGRRDSASQARIMYDNLEAKGIKAQRSLYGSNGDKVIDVYETKKKAGENATAIKDAMKGKIVELGCSSVSRHCSDTHDVFDVAPSSLADRPKFEKALADSLSNGDISDYLQPPKDPAYHIVIKLDE